MTLSEDQIRSIAREAAREAATESARYTAQVAAERAVVNILARLGIDAEEDWQEVQRDTGYLRKQRRIAEKGKVAAIMAGTSAAATGVFSVLFGKFFK